MNLKKPIAAALVSVMLLTACTAGSSSDADTTTNASASASASANVNTPAADVTPTEIVNAVLTEVPITSGLEKGMGDISDFYSDIDASQIEGASFVICASGAYPDEIAVMKCTDSSAAASVKASFEKRLASQSELYSTYTPDEMYKLETAEVYTIGNYAILLAVSDNDRAKEIVDSKLS